MSIVTPNEFWELNRKTRTDLLNAIPTIQYATVTGITPSGKAIIRFTGDKAPSEKIYPSLKSYVPAIGERVMLLNNVILGGVYGLDRAFVCT